MTATPQHATVRSEDGTSIAFQTLGTGPGLIVVGGSLASGEDYLPLARALASAFTVHVMDRRGRGNSGPQRDDHDLGAEVSDLLAVQRVTGATTSFGHSFGGLVCLEAGRVSTALTRIALYEPGVSIDGSIPAEWLPRFRQLLDKGDTRGAFTTMVRSAGYAPRPLTLMPFWCAKLILSQVVRGDTWRKTEQLLATQGVEHEVLARIKDSPQRYAGVTADVLVLYGGKSPSFAGADLVAALAGTLPRVNGCRLAGLGHAAPSNEAPEKVAQALVARLTEDSLVEQRVPPGAGHGEERGPRSPD